MSQNPLEAIRRRSPREAATFPDALYDERVLRPQERRALETLGDAAREVYVAHAIMLAEQRVVDSATVGAALKALESPWEPSATPQHPLAGIEGAVASLADGQLLLGTAQEEVIAGAVRIALRSSVLELADELSELRTGMSALAAGHLNTLLPMTAHGQVVQPTSLAHYLSGQLAPLDRAHERLQQAFARLNVSPLGAVSGMATAMPVRRERAAELLGFDGAIEHSIDAIAAADVLHEFVSIAAMTAVELMRFVGDLTHWSRDDVGFVTPGAQYLHTFTAQPHRRDPLVLEHLRLELTDVAAAPGRLTLLLGGRIGLGSTAEVLRLFDHTNDALHQLSRACELLTLLVGALDVDRATVAMRTNRGFSTSSELADLLAIDFRIPAAQARALAEQVVLEALREGQDATSVTPELVDRVALRLIGREIGIEPELLSRCLAPRRFLERRDVLGGPAPTAVRAMLERESFRVRQDRAWVRDTRARLEAANQRLRQRRDEIVAGSRPAAGGTETGSEG